MGRDAQAVDEFIRFLKVHPSSVMVPDAEFWLGEYYSSKGKFDKAREYYYAIAKDFPSSDLSGRAFYQAALTFLDEGKGEDAIAKFEELASKFPDSEYVRNAYRKIAKFKKDAKDIDGAIEYLIKARGAQNNELNAQLQYEIAESFEEKGDLAGAAEEYLKVPALYPKGVFWSVRAELKSAQIFEKIERLDEAKKLYEKLAGMDVEESAFAKKRLEWMKQRK